MNRKNLTELNTGNKSTVSPMWFPDINQGESGQMRFTKINMSLSWIIDDYLSPIISNVKLEILLVFYQSKVF